MDNRTLWNHAPALRLFAGLNSQRKAADYFGVSLRTWQRWEKLNDFKSHQLDALRARAGFVTAPGWRGFMFREDRLYSPTGLFVARHEAENMWLYRQIKSHNERPVHPQTEFSF
jgi:hypothetical protein